MNIKHTESTPLDGKETAQVSHLGGKRQKEGGIVCSALGCRYHTLGVPAITGAAIPRWLAKVLNILCMGSHSEPEITFPTPNAIVQVTESSTQV